METFAVELAERRKEIGILKAEKEKLLREKALSDREANRLQKIVYGRNK